MNYSPFIDYLGKYGNLSEERKSLLRSRSVHMVVQEKQVILKPGEMCHYMHFANEGFYRNFRLNKKEKTTNFIGPNEFMTCISGFFYNAFALDGLICDQQGSVTRISFHDWQQMCDEDHEFSKISTNIIIEYLRNHYEQSHIYRTCNTKDKVIQLCEIHPGILQKTAQKNIASFFGVSDQTISTIIASL